MLVDDLSRLRDQADALNARVRPSFSRHETFHVRFGWLRKGFAQSVVNPEAFLQEDAPVALGVGKNMVRAIRYWCLAFKILEEFPNPERPRLRCVRPTEFGRLLMGRRGWDPYLEDPASLWLLHWQLLSPQSLAPAWHVAFVELDGPEFSDHDVLAALQRFRDRMGWEDIVDGSLRKDVSCLLRTYASREAQGRHSEESLDSPFTQLDLIQKVEGGSRRYRFNTLVKPSLPPAMVAFASCDYMSMLGGGARTIAVRRLALDSWSPGRAFRVSEATLVESLRTFASERSDVSLTNVAGAPQLVFDVDPRDIAESTLSNYYLPRKRRAA